MSGITSVSSKALGKCTSYLLTLRHKNMNLVMVLSALLHYLIDAMKQFVEKVVLKVDFKTSS